MFTLILSLTVWLKLEESIVLFSPPFDCDSCPTDDGNTGLVSELSLDAVEDKYACVLGSTMLSCLTIILDSLELMISRTSSVTFGCLHTSSASLITSMSD